MDWKYNTIWFDQIERNNLFHNNYKDNLISNLNFEDVEYAMTFHFKYKGFSFDLLPKSSKLLYLEMNWANFKDLAGINKFEKLKRLELHYCTKLENDYNISSLKDTLEFLHINQSKKYTPTAELFELKKLKVLCLNACGPIENLNFLSNFPKLVDFRFVDTNILDGDLTPILEHPTIRTVGFLNKRHYNYSDKHLKSILNLKSSEEFKEFVYKGEYKTYKYNYE
ncbi:hypothetical protein [Flavobacterium sp. GT3P67]|uniref:hypothetical protein n=1 Tax=Flavobacterium sp. GT3P67 TaxID=2541722 RepID=UPI00104FFDAF|nr:hypothetical protein [Flavobacterium sp. GT3P67]TDE49125.1 hypothetical protein E0H99_16085 [Flavobacterium sp. GT3P67]